MSAVRLALLVFVALHIAVYLQNERYSKYVDGYDLAIYSLVHKVYPAPLVHSKFGSAGSGVVFTDSRPLLACLSRLARVLIPSIAAQATDCFQTGSRRKLGSSNQAPSTLMTPSWSTCSPLCISAAAMDCSQPAPLSFT